MSTPTEHEQAPTPDPENSPDAESLHTKLANLLDNITVLEESGDEATGDPDRNGADASPLKDRNDHAVPSAAPIDQEPTNDDQMLPSAVKIRGRPGGVLIEVGEGEWSELLQVVDERIGAAEGFFRGGRAVLEVGPRVLVEDDLRHMRSVLERHDMKLGIVRSTTERTLQAALELGLSTSSDETPELPPAVPENRPVVPITPPKSPYFVHHGTLRSGQVLRKAESIVIVGDVNPGAQVISAGDVMVWGKLRGMAHAGAGGNRNAVVAALDFGPTQLRIANVTAVAPETKKPSRGLFFWRKTPETRPEVAHVAEGRIVVEPWDEKKTGRPRPIRRA
jgi:septum site-determining protein MinC